MEDRTPPRRLLREGVPLVPVVVVFAVLVYATEWVRTDLGPAGGVFAGVGMVLIISVSVTGLGLVVLYAVARGVAIGTEEDGNGNGNGGRKE